MIVKLWVFFGRTFSEETYILSEIIKKELDEELEARSIEINKCTVKLNIQRSPLEQIETYHIRKCCTCYQEVVNWNTCLAEKQQIPI
jgi:hypothetical protein